MNYVAITSNQLRHREFIDRLQKKVDLSLVVVVKKKEGNSEFCCSERLAFGGDKDPIEAPLVECTPIQLNSRRMVDLITEVNPEVCFVFGAPLLKEKIFRIPKRGCINLHTGLVQHHRGVDSPYWALYERRPELLGATLHYIDSSIDGGDIISQAITKDLKVTDSPDDIFMKTCATGFDILEESVYNILKGSVESHPLSQYGNRGKLYQNKDMDYGTMLEIRYQTPIVLKEYLNGNNS
jgi:folate-dependent phosphoribosylglycinamide formyltransferase PurN